MAKQTHRSRLMVVVLTAALANQAATLRSEDLRTWTDSTGRHTTEAQFIGLEGSEVVLQRLDGKRVRVPLHRLSEADRQVARAMATQKSGEAARQQRGEPSEGVTATVKLSEQVPIDLMLPFELEDQRPLIASLKLEGERVVDSVKYGMFRFESIKDDQGRPLKLLAPIEGKFKEDLGKSMADINHFFLEQPNRLTIYLVLQNPGPTAKRISINGSCRFHVKESITIENVLSKLGAPLTDERLTKIGRFRISRPDPEEAEPEESLAIDFSGNRKGFDDIDLLRGDGYKISTGGFGGAENSGHRIVRWAGEVLPVDTKLRIVLSDQPVVETIPINLKNIAISKARAARPAEMTQADVDGHRESSQVEQDPPRGDEQSDHIADRAQPPERDASNEQNLALHATHTCSSERPDGRFGLTNAFDGNHRTLWVSRQGNSNGAWVAMQWSQSVTIRQIKFREVKDRIINMTVQRLDADSGGWIDLLHIFGNRHLSSYSKEGKEKGWGYRPDAVWVDGQRLGDQKSREFGTTSSEIHPKFTINLPDPLETTGLRLLVKQSRGDRVAFYEVEAY